jgi:ribosomal protein S18 acetylase RimI-like enzyme
MTSPTSVEEAVEALTGDPLRHVVLLKQLLAYPDHVEIHRAAGPEGCAMLVALDTSVSPYDRQTYPGASLAAFIASDHPRLTEALLPHLPPDAGIVFKLSREADVAPIAARSPVVRRTAFVSFTSSVRYEPDAAVRVTSQPGDSAFALFEEQGHERAWLEPMLRAGKAFACVLLDAGETRSACFAFENHGPVWEVGGVVTAPQHRRKRLAARVVRTALAALGTLGLVPRYQVEEHNTASIGLARSLGLVPFLTIVHYAHSC